MRIDTRFVTHLVIFFTLAPDYEQGTGVVSCVSHPFNPPPPTVEFDNAYCFTSRDREISPFVRLAETYG